MRASPPSQVEADLPERIAAIVESLLRERRVMAGGRATAVELEANRLAIVYWQQELERLNAARSSTRSAPNG